MRLFLRGGKKMLEIRKLTEQEYDECLALSEYAFQYQLSDEDKEKRKLLLKKQEIWGEFEDGTLLSKLQLIPLQIFIEGKEYEMGGIASVATWPEHRRKGSVARLLKQALLSMKEQSQTISFLHPFNVGFYRKFGWELSVSLKKYFIEAKDLYFYPNVAGKVIRVDKKESWELLNTIYESYAGQYNGMLKRQEYWWEHRVYPEGFRTAVYLDEHNTAKGYMFYKISERMMDIQELVYLDEEVRRGLWNYISQHDSMIEKIKIVAPSDDQLPFLLKNPKMQQEMVSYFMARIVDLQKFLAEHPISKVKEPLLLHITDEFADWNTGTYTIEEGTVTFQAEAEPKEKGITADIQTLTALLLGAQQPRFLYQCGKLQGEKEEIEKLEQAISLKTSCFFDFF
jgi:predicted acetyltransferase